MFWLSLTLTSPFPYAPYDDLSRKAILLQPSFSPVPRPYKRPSQERASKPLLRVVPFLRHHSSNLLRRGKASVSLRPDPGEPSFHALRLTRVTCPKVYDAATSLGSREDPAASGRSLIGQRQDAKKLVATTLKPTLPPAPGPAWRGAAVSICVTFGYYVTVYR